MKVSSSLKHKCIIADRRLCFDSQFITKGKGLTSALTDLNLTLDKLDDVVGLDIDAGHLYVSC